MHFDSRPSCLSEQLSDHPELRAKSSRSSSSSSLPPPLTAKCKGLDLDSMCTTGNWLPLATRIGQRRLPQVRRQPFAHMERLFSLDFDLIASWTWRADRSEGKPVFRLGGRNHHDQVHNHCTDVVAAPRTDSERAKHEAGVNN